MLAEQFQPFCIGISVCWFYFVSGQNQPCPIIIQIFFNSAFEQPRMKWSIKQTSNDWRMMEALIL